MRQFWKVREQHTCVACGGSKDKGTLLCWPCHDRECNHNTGAYSPETEQKLGMLEARINRTGHEAAKPSSISITGLEANVLLFALDNYLGVTSDGLLARPEPGYKMADLQALRDRLFAVHEHPANEQEIVVGFIPLTEDER